MIRRGLQILLVGLALEAAPVMAQTWQNHPDSVTLTGFPVQTDGSSLNGFWVLTRFTSDPSREYTQFNSDTPNKLFITYNYNQVLQIEIAPNYKIGILYSKTYYPFSSTNSLPRSITGFSNSNGAPAALDAAMIPHYTVEEGEANFPDWNSAAVKIPFGFSFAMTFWAAAVGLTVAMKWVRDLASAAT